MSVATHLIPCGNHIHQMFWPRRKASRFSTLIKLIIYLLIVFVIILNIRYLVGKGGTYSNWEYPTPPHDNEQAGRLPIENVYIVYNAFINLKRPNWVDFINQQLSNLASNGLLERANELHVCLSIDAMNHDGAVVKSSVDKISSIVYSIVPESKVFVSVTYSNQFEFPGIHKVWEIGQRTQSGIEASQSLVLYFHSKGMFNGNMRKNPRGKRELQLFRTVIDPWNSILERLSTDLNINKVGYAATAFGYMWFNFWWARISYVKKLVEPELTDDRYYYERWLGRLQPQHIWSTSPNMMHFQLRQNDSRGLFHSSGDCLSLCRSNVPVGVNFPMRHPCEYMGLTYLQKFLSELLHFFL